ncbi:hypothetical protein NP493_293g04054 [Ridgeia piscesae]|uniref:Cytochrome P450 n=1 Tax=Ridgeia piscesae TaxID=27915 RepID=A0AAD9NWQ3_RIDPI|nr:hypothetical protein NP493_293g04054 [Ridgeia piscesae]
MIRNPDVQKRCREEIFQVIGPDRPPCMKDRGTLPYTEATLLEIHRLGSVLATALTHTVSKPVKFRGYDLPEGTLVIPNLYQSHMDPEIWEDPFAIKPDRWLDENNKLKTNPAFMPFSVGCRMCIGETLARMQMFLFGTALLQRFEFRMVDADNPPTTEGLYGMSRVPYKYELLASAT